MDVFDLTAKLTLDSSEYDKSLGQAENKTSSFGSALGGVVSGVGVAVGAATAVIGAVGTTIATTTSEIASATVDVSEYGDSIDKMSQKMGISAVAYQEWDAVMQHSGTSMESLKASMKTLANAAEKNNEAFATLGITEEQIANMSNEDLFGEVITKLQDMGESTERTYLAGQLLGRGATELGALLNTSAEDTQAMKDRVHELGGVMSDDAVKASAQFQDNLQDLQTSFDGLKRNILSDLLPGLNDLTAGFTSLLAGEDTGGEQIASGIEKFIDGILKAGEKISNIAIDILPNIISSVAEKFPSLVSSLTAVFPELVSGIVDALTTSVIPSILDALPMIVQPLADSIPELLMQFMTLFMENLPMLLELGVSVIESLGEGLASAYPLLLPMMYELIGTIQKLIIRNLPRIIAVAGDILVALVEGFANSTDVIIFGITSVMLELVATIIKMIPTLIKVGVELISALIGAMVDNGIKIFRGDYFAGLLDVIIDVWNNIDWAGIGKGIIDGIINGITNGWNRMKDSVKSVTDGIKNLFTSAFDIHSPSKLFEYYGEMMMSGLDKGLTDNMSEIEGDVNTLNKGIASELGGISVAGVGGDIIIPVYIGQEQLQTIVVDALNIANYRSGGR